MTNGGYFVWGAGTYGARLIEFMKDEMTFKAVIDNNPAKQGTAFCGLPVIGYERAKKDLPGVKIVIAQVYPNAVRNFLFGEGYEEYTDFFSIYDFIPRYFWDKKAEIVPKVVNFAPANFCNLKCAHCQSYMQLCKDPRATSLEDLKSDMDMLFSHIDSVFLINLCLGESFVNKDLPEFAEYARDKYYGGYGSLVILTNGTIVPADADMKTLADAEAILSISDYSDKSPEIKKSLSRLVERCERYGVKYYLNTSSDTSVWFDFGDPLTVTETQPEKLKLRYNRCFKPGNGIMGGKLYLCQLHNAAQSVAGVSPPGEGDCFDLRQPKTEQSVRDLLKIIMRTPDRGYVEHCKRCNGTLTIAEAAALG